MRSIFRAEMRSPLCLRAKASRASGIVAVVVLAIQASVLAKPALASGDLELVPDFTGTLLVMLAGFVLLIFPLNALLFQPIFRALDERANRIAGARQRSEQLGRDADEVLGRYEAAIREARGESEAARQVSLEGAREEQAARTASARSEAERELERARAELSRSVDEARATLRSNAEQLAQAAAERVLGRVLS
jgi:F-type H+-transporting ATPase subunit b